MGALAYLTAEDKAALPKEVLHQIRMNLRGRPGYQVEDRRRRRGGRRPPAKIRTVH